MKQRVTAAVVLTLWLLVGCTPTETERASQEDEASSEPKKTAAREKTDTQEKTDAQKKAKTSPKAATKAGAASEPDEQGSEQGNEQGDYDATVTVTNVVDGDTVDFSPAVEGRTRVRFIGVDTPETRECPGGQPLSQEAKAYTTAELQGQEVDLEFDEDREDQYDRLLAYVYEDDEMFNEDLLEEGYAQVATFPPNTHYVDRFLAAQEQARSVPLGIWALSEEELAAQTDRGNGIGGGGCAQEQAPTPPPESTPDPDPDRDVVLGVDAPRATPTPSPRPAPTPPKQKSAPPTPKAGGDVDCGDFSTKAEAQPYLLPGDPNRLDRDGDGQACDSLP